MERPVERPVLGLWLKHWLKCWLKCWLNEILIEMPPANLGYPASALLRHGQESAAASSHGEANPGRGPGRGPGGDPGRAPGEETRLRSRGDG